MKKGVIAVLSMMIGAAAGSAGIGYFKGQQVKQKAEKVDKFKGYYNMLNQWLMLKQEGKSLDQYFVKNGYKSIAIYGMGEIGSRLYDELKNTDITIAYAIDKNAANTYSDLEVLELDDNLEEVDAVIVTAFFAFSEIEEELSSKLDCPIISIEDVVYES
jgi:hypothetical protein